MFACIVFLWLMSTCMGRRERQCSSFHYEEKLLEKMIRTEIKVEEMAGDMRTSQQAVTNAVGSLADFEGKWGTFQDEIKQQVAAYFEDVKKTNEQWMKTTSERLDSLSERLNAANEGPVAFLVEDMKYNTLRESDVIIFPDVNFNLGNGYDPSTGKFTAPGAGIYMVSAFLCVNGGQLPFAIVKDGHKILFGEFTDTSSSYTECGSATVTVKLETNESVWVMSTASTSTLYSDRLRKNFLSGSLLQRL